MSAKARTDDDGAMTEAQPDTAVPHDSVAPPPLRRPFHGRMLAGVAAGVAEYLQVDVVLVRIALVVLTFLGGAGVVAYVAAWLLVPEEGAPVSMAEHWVEHFRSAA